MSEVIRIEGATVEPSSTPAPEAEEAEPEALRADEAEPEKAAAPRKPSFRVRVSQKSGPRSRYLVVSANDPAQAGRKALREVGKDEWEVLEVRLA